MQLQREPLNTDRNVDGEMVQLGNTIDDRKGREIPVISVSVYNRGLERYEKICYQEPPTHIRPSLNQFTCILALKAEGSMYVDLSVFAAHSQRTAKSLKLDGLILGADGRLCRVEQKGPPDHATYSEGAAVHECGVIMAEMVNPPPPAVQSGASRLCS